MVWMEDGKRTEQNRARNTKYNKMSTVVGGGDEGWRVGGRGRAGRRDGVEPVLSGDGGGGGGTVRGRPGW